MCGLSVRTIQRVESGQKASMETLKSLASVFEVNIETLTKEIIVIDKTTEKWRNLPWLYRLNMQGINSRKALIRIECITIIGGFVLLFVQLDAFKQVELLSVPVIFVCAYIISLLIRFGDEKDVW